MDPLHPNPQFTRPAWTSLNGPWEFAIDADASITRPDDVMFDQTIEVPFAPETPASGIEHTGFFHACWYRRTFTAPKFDRGQRLLLRFGAVDHRATIYLNGQVVATHEGGYTPFHADVTPHLNSDGENTLIVHAYDDPHDVAKPRGKQDWEEQPHAIWYPRTTGIWQSVWLETVGSSHFDTVSWTPHYQDRAVDLEAHIAHPVDGLRLRVRIESTPPREEPHRFQGDQSERRALCDDTYTLGDGELHRRISLIPLGLQYHREDVMWQPQRPRLMAATLELLDAEGHVLDTLLSYFGLRSTGTDAGHYLLNNRAMRLRLVLDQGYWADTGLTPPDDDAARRDVELTLAMGFDGVRAHQRIADPRWLYYADVLGMLVWEELPSALQFSDTATRRLTREWTDVIQRDRSHPCIIAWLTLNESWGVPDLSQNPAERHLLRTLYHLTHTLDPTRPVIGNDGWQNDPDATDIIGVHDYTTDPQRIAYRYANGKDEQAILDEYRPAGFRTVLEPSTRGEQPIMLTEFGGLSIKAEDTWGYEQMDSADDLHTRYRELWAALSPLKIFSGWCYTQLADTYQEANGLLTMDREPKFPIEDIREATRG